MDITKFKIGGLKNEEWVRFHFEFSDKAEECGINVLEIGRVYPRYKEMLKEADLQLEVVHKSFHTQETKIADQQRGDAYRGVRDTARSLLKSIDPADQAAATKVYAVAAKYNNSIQKGTLPARTAAIDNLLQDLTSAEGGDAKLAGEVQQLGLGKWVASLATTNENYKQALAQRIAEEAARPKAGRLPELRSEIDRYYTRMMEVVDTRLLTIPDTGEEEEEAPPSGPVEERTPDTDDAKVLHFAKELNRIIARYHAILKGRQTRKENQASEEEEENVEGEDDLQ